MEFTVCLFLSLEGLLWVVAEDEDVICYVLRREDRCKIWENKLP